MMPLAGNDRRRCAARKIDAERALAAIIFTAYAVVDTSAVARENKAPEWYLVDR